MNIFVARLDYGITDDDLRTAFEAYGEVESAKIIIAPSSVGKMLC